MTSSPTFSEVTGIAVFAGLLAEKQRSQNGLEKEKKKEVYHRKKLESERKEPSYGHTKPTVSAFCRKML